MCIQCHARGCVHKYMHVLLGDYLAKVTQAYIEGSLEAKREALEAESLQDTWHDNIEI